MKRIIYILCFCCPLLILVTSCNTYSSREQIHSMLYSTGIYPVYIPIMNNTDTVWCLVEPDDVFTITYGEKELTNLICNKKIITNNPFLSEMLLNNVIVDKDMEQCYHKHGIDETIKTYNINQLQLEQVIYLGLLCWWNDIFIYYGCEDGSWHYIF